MFTETTSREMNAVKSLCRLWLLDIEIPPPAAISSRQVVVALICSIFCSSDPLTDQTSARRFFSPVQPCPLAFEARWMFSSVRLLTFDPGSEVARPQWRIFTQGTCLTNHVS